MPEYTFNPDTGSGEQVVRGGGANEPSSMQERADLQQSISFRNTASHLAERAEQKAGTDASQVGGSNNLETEQKLLETQKELYDLNNGTLPHDPLRMLQLEALQNTLAESLVSGKAPSDIEQVAPSSENKEWDVDDLKQDLESELANDPATQETIAWSAQTFSDETKEVFNEMLDEAISPTLTQAYMGELNKLKANPSAFSTEDASGRDLSPSTIQQIQTNYSPELSKDILTLTAAVTNGVVSRQDAMITALKSPKLAEALLELAHNPDIDFTISL